MKLDPIKPYLALLTVPRSGSTWLSELLAYNGLAYPAEHLWRLRDKFSQNDSVDVIKSNLQEQYAHFIFHLKLNPILHHFPPNMYSSKLMAEDWNFITKHGGIDIFVESTQIFTIILWRKDFFDQAFSYSSSIKSGSWYNTNSEEMDSPDINFVDFMQSLNFMIKQYEDIVQAYNQAEIKPLVLNYEATKKAPSEGIREAFNYCKQKPPKLIVTETPIKTHNYKTRAIILSEYIDLCSRQSQLMDRIRAVQTSLESITFLSKK